MSSDASLRLWLPLMILDEAGPIHTKIKFQKIAFLTQYLSKLDVYDFKKHHYGPYSQTFDLDTLCYPKLISHSVNPSSLDPKREYYSFELTSNGKQQLVELQKNLKLSPDKISEIKHYLSQFKDKGWCELMEEAYSKFALERPDSENLFLHVKDELLDILPPISNCFNTYHNRQSTFVLSILEIIDKSLHSLECVEDTVQRGVVLNLSHELIQHCKNLSDEIVPPADTKSLKSKFLEIAEIESFLREYCDTRGIMTDPFKLSLEEIFTEEEVDSLSQAMKEVKIPV